MSTAAAPTAAPTASAAKKTTTTTTKATRAWGRRRCAMIARANAPRDSDDTDARAGAMVARDATAKAVAVVLATGVFASAANAYDQAVRVNVCER